MMALQNVTESSLHTTAPSACADYSTTIAVQT